MNRADDFEQQLRSLRPAAPPDDEASVMYACGYAAGRNAVLNETATSAAVRWKLAAAVLLASVLSGWGGYGLAVQQADTPQLAVAPKPVDRPPTVSVQQPVIPPPQQEEIVAVAESDPTVKPAEPVQVPRGLQFSLRQFLIPSASPAVSSDAHGVVLTARSDSADWTRWMQERPFEHHRRQKTASDRAVPEAATRDTLTPMQWRRGDVDWEQWIH